MVHIENEESNEMQAVSDTINMLPGHDASNDPASTKSEQQQVNMAAQKLSKLTKSADMDEFKQQAAAEKAKAQVQDTCFFHVSQMIYLCSWTTSSWWLMVANLNSERRKTQLGVKEVKERAMERAHFSKLSQPSSRCCATLCRHSKCSFTLL